MRYLLVFPLFCIFMAFIISCNKTPISITNSNFTDSISQKPVNEHSVEVAENQYTGKVVHVLVALCDNINQGIVPVPSRLGNGEDLQNNLYWGAAYGVKSFLIRKDSDWQLISSIAPLNQFILEQCIFKHKKREVYLIADAYKGAEIKRCILDFLESAAGKQNEKVIALGREIKIAGNADLIVYVGHDGLMDFSLETYPKKQNDKPRETIMLCCFSKRFFGAPLRSTGATPLLWTTGLMAPEAYILKAALDSWLLGENGEQVRSRAASSYHQYQRCGLSTAQNLFVSGW